MMKISYINDIDRVAGLLPEERAALREVTGFYRFRANDYYLSLINWDDPDDPLRRVIIPQAGELEPFGELDASVEESNYVAPGCQHKYPHTVLLLCNGVCAGYCRFCFRKRLFKDDNEETVIDLSDGIAYIRENPQVTNVLLTGGDPLLLSTSKLERIVAALREIDHVKIIRIGTKIPAFNPYRIIDDPGLAAMISRYSRPGRRLYLMVHFCTPKELTDTALRGLDILHQAGALLCNQSPILNGINARPEILAELMRRLSFAGVPPYYFFQCRPTAGNKPFITPLTASYLILEEAKKSVSGLAKRARLVMSHERGKIEILAVTEDRIFLKFHRARRTEDKGLFMAFHRDDDAYWLDDLVPAGESVHPVRQFGHQLTRAFGPD